MQQETFYSPRGNLCFSINPGRIEEVDGHKMRIGHKLAEFMPMGSGTPDPEHPGRQLPPYGCFKTTDPEIIAGLPRHREELMSQGQRPDILTPEEYQAAVVPKTKQISDLNRRVIELQSQLKDVLAAQGKIPSVSLPERRGPGRPSKAELAAREDPQSAA